MQSYFLIVTLSLFPLAYSDCENYPIFTACDTKIVTAVNAFRKTTEVFSNNPNVIEPGKRFYCLHTSYDYKNEHNKYLVMDTTESTLNFTFVPKDGGPSGVLNYTTKQNEDGTLTGTPIDPTCPDNRKYRWITVLKGSGFVINYVCTDVDGSSDPPLTVFWVTKESYNSHPLTKSLLTRAKSLLQSLGFNIKYSYEEIFSSNSEGSGISGLMPGLIKPISGSIPGL